MLDLNVAQTTHILVFIPSIKIENFTGLVIFSNVDLNKSENEEVNTRAALFIAM